MRTVLRISGNRTVDVSENSGVLEKRTVAAVESRGTALGTCSNRSPAVR
jgi:hypothetical protein